MSQDRRKGAGIIIRPAKGVVFNVQVHDENWNERLHRRLVGCDSQAMLKEVERWLTEEWDQRQQRAATFNDLVPTTTLTLEAFHVA